MENNNFDTVFSLGKNKGIGNAKKLLGDNFEGVGVSVTDDYEAYTNIFIRQASTSKKGNHVLCWAHPHRKFRDLKKMTSVSSYKAIHT